MLINLLACAVNKAWHGNVAAKCTHQSARQTGLHSHSWPLVVPCPWGLVGHSQEDSVGSP